MQPRKSSNSLLWQKVVRLCHERGSVTIDVYDQRRAAARWSRAVGLAVRLGFVERKGFDKHLAIYGLTKDAEGHRDTIPLALAAPAKRSTNNP